MLFVLFSELPRWILSSVFVSLCMYMGVHVYVGRECDHWDVSRSRKLHFIWGSWWCGFLSASSRGKRGTSALGGLPSPVLNYHHPHSQWARPRQRVSVCLDRAWLRKDLSTVHHPPPPPQTISPPLCLSTAQPPVPPGPDSDTIIKLSWKLKLTFQLWGVWTIFSVSLFFLSFMVIQLIQSNL